MRAFSGNKLFVNHQVHNRANFCEKNWRWLLPIVRPHQIATVLTSSLMRLTKRRNSAPNTKSANKTSLPLAE